MTHGAVAQNEFVVYNNGFIYNETTMQQLEYIVDSLNLKFQSCDLNKTYYSKKQTIGHIISIDSLNVKNARKDIDQNISFPELCKKYPNIKVDSNVLIVQFRYKNSDHKDMIEFSEIDLDSYSGFKIQKKYIPSDKKPTLGSWLYEYFKKSKYSNESIKAFYFPREFQSIELSQIYAQQIGYADCLIDTLSAKFNDNLKDGWVDLPGEWQKLTLDKKQKLLDELRSTRVVGTCSQDHRPREHAINIALLSAETTSWEVFLRAHLDIMNDRFERVSDGSYAWEGRKTYIKELEQIDINVLDLLLGITLRIENPALNHYYGNISRLGRSISESQNKANFDIQILSMIEDDTLDDFNRVLAYFLFLNSNSYLENNKEKQDNLEKLKLSVNKLPEYLKRRIAIGDE